MGERRTKYNESTLDLLFEDLISAQLSHDEEEAVISRKDRAVEYRKGILAAGSSANAAADVKQAADLIRRKLLPDSEKVVKFSNLYSRLQSLPVLRQKWPILYLLYNLSEEVSSEKRLSEHKASDKRPNSPILQRERQSNVERGKNVSSRRGAQSINGNKDNPHLDRAGVRTNGTVTPMVDRLRRSRAESRLSSRLEKREEESVNGDIASKKKDYTIEPTESALLRDFPFNLQGLSSAHMVFTSAAVRLPQTLPTTILSLLHTLAEPCLLYRGLADFLEESGGGLVVQSLRAAIGNELRSYLSLVATLEAEIRRALTALENEDEKQGIRRAGVTLKRCVIWTRDATMGLRLMSVMVEESNQKRGGQLISLVHGFSSSHGDPFVGAFARRLMANVTKPFYDMLRHWIYDGELTDPYHEFLVAEPDPATRLDLDPRRVATSVWEDKYQLETAMVPSIVSDDLAKKIFLIGKSLNFLRHNCSDSDWVMEYSKSASKELRYGDTASLESSIDEAYKTTMARLTNLMSSKYHLFDHLNAIKKYILLSQGDFVALLMESLALRLDTPANSLYRHTLTSQLLHAIRNSNAQYDDPEILLRLDARMLELSSGEIGWDCFTLEYKLSPPCDVVITQWANTQYLKVFNLLWRVKRVEFSLSSTWRRCMTGSRGVLSAVDDKLGSDWKKARCVIAEMIHFVNQLQHYILFEVVEASWDELQTAIHKPDTTLDDLIDAHTKYINSITRKGLLGSQRHTKTGQNEDSFLSQLHYILKAMLSYRDTVDGLYSFSVAEFTRRQEFSARIEHRTAQGKWGITERDLLPSDSSRPSTPTLAPTSKSAKHASLLSDGGVDSPFHAPIASAGLMPGSDDKTVLASLRARLLELSAEFRSRLNVFLYDLAHQADVDMRFLGVVMNFNEVYRPVNVRRQMQIAAYAARKEKERKELRDGERKGLGLLAQGREGEKGGEVSGVTSLGLEWAGEDGGGDGGKERGVDEGVIDAREDEAREREREIKVPGSYLSMEHLR